MKMKSNLMRQPVDTILKLLLGLHSSSWYGWPDISTSILGPNDAVRVIYSFDGQREWFVDLTGNVLVENSRRNISPLGEVDFSQTAKFCP